MKVSLTFLCAVLLASWSLCNAEYRRRDRAVRRRSFESRRRSSPGPPRCPSDVTREEVAEAYENKVKAAEFVFTGKVTRILDGGHDLPSIHVDGDGKDFNDKQKLIQVKIKRSLKGDFPWSIIEWELTKPHLHKTVDMVVLARNEVDREEVQGGDGSHNHNRNHNHNHRCRHLLRQNHTAIFLATHHPGSTNQEESFLLQLTSNPLTLTLRNLDKVNAVVKDSLTCCPTTEPQESEREQD